VAKLAAGARVLTAAMVMVYATFKSIGLAPTWQVNTPAADIAEHDVKVG